MAETPAVCITGMHRSGTSMAARVLHAAGLWLGSADSLMPAQADNPEGFFEHLELVRLGDEVLDHLGAAWDMPPPPLDALRAAGPLLEPLAERARALLGTLAAGAAPGSPWGWKDPRASLVLAFWRLRLPGLRIVACLRHPLDVARSLKQRHRVSMRFGLRLWQSYNEALLVQVQAGATLVTHYESWLLEPEAELRRIAEHIGLPLEQSRLADAVREVRSGPARARDDSADALLAAAGQAAVVLYDILRARAGPVYERHAHGSPRQSWPDATPISDAMGAADDELLLLRERVAALDTELKELRRRVAPYRVGTLIDARKGGNAPLYLEAGWAVPQDAGTWSIREQASLALQLHGLPVGTGAVVHVRLRPMIGPGHEAMKVSLQVAGMALATWMLTEAKVVELSCTLAAELLAAQVPLRLEFIVDSPCSPLSIGLSADSRPLGVLLVSLALRAGEGPAV